MADEFDPFKSSSSLPDDFDGEIQECWFEFDPNYQDGQALVIKMKCMTNDETFGEGGLGELMYSCGKDWTVEGRGESAVRRDGRTDKGFTTSTAYDLFIQAAIACPGAENVLRSAGRGDPRKAAMWNGTSWHFERKGHDYKGNIGVVERLLPTKFLGEKGISSVEAQVMGNQASATAKKAVPTKAAAPTKAAGPVKKAATPAPAPAPVSNNGAATFDESHPLWETLWAVAYDAADHESFVEAAFGTIAGVAGDDVVEQGVMANGPDSLWAKVVVAYEAANQG